MYQLATIRPTQDFVCMNGQSLINSPLITFLFPEGDTYQYHPHAQGTLFLTQWDYCCLCCYLLICRWIL